jgi:HEAT repeat protein
MPDTDQILELLKSEDATNIREGAFSAGDAGLVDAVPLLVELVLSTNLGVQEAADRALRKIGGPETVAAVAPLLRSDDAPVRNVAMDVLREVGDQDFDTLVDLLHDEDPDIRIFTSDILGATGNVMAVSPLCTSLLKDPEVNVRYQAAVSLGSLGFPEAARCLNKALEDEEWVQFSVIEALTKIRDESSVAALGKALETSSDLVASMIVEALGEMGNVKAVPILLRRIEPSPTALRNIIVKAIVNILGGKSLALLSPTQREQFRQYLLIALHDDEVDIQNAAITGLAYVGGEQASAELLEIVDRLDPVRDVDRLNLLAESLAHIGMTGAIGEAIVRGPYKKTLVAVQAVGNFTKPEDKSEGLRTMMTSFWDVERDLQRAFAETLADEARADEAVDFFLDVLERHDDGEVLKSGCRFLGDSGHAPAAQKLFELLEHEFDDVKEAALEGIIALGDPRTTGWFESMLGSSDPMKRLMAVYAIGSMNPAENLDHMRLALEDEIPDIRKIAIESIARICCTDESILELVVSRIYDESREVRLTVVEAVAGCDIAKARPFLLQALEDDDEWVRIRAMEALAAAHEPEAVPHLIPILESGNKLLTLKVVESLGEIGGQEAFLPLLEIVNSDDPELAAAAEEAVTKIRERSEEG